jgi:hypothetical protein
LVNIPAPWSIWDIMKKGEFGDIYDKHMFPIIFPYEFAF